MLRGHFGVATAAAAGPATGAATGPATGPATGAATGVAAGAASGYSAGKNMFFELSLAKSLPNFKIRAALESA